jgi:hypothetical protein
LTEVDQLTREDFSAVVGARGAIALFAAHDTVRQRVVEKANSLGFDLPVVAVLPNTASGLVMYLLRPAAQ